VLGHPRKTLPRFLIGALFALSATALGWWLSPLCAEAAGPAVRMTLRLSGPLIAANGVSTTTATATVTDAKGHGMARQVILLRSSDGRRWWMSHHGNGIYTAKITSSTRAGAFVITAHDLSGAPPDAHATLTQYGRATHVSVALSPAVILGDNASFTTATATVTDALGDPVPAENVRFTSTDPGQTFGPTTNHRNGVYTAQIRASGRPGQATITAKDQTEGISGRATLRQVPNPSTTTLVVPQSPVVTNQVVTLVAAITSAAGSPSGTITFAANGAAVPGCVAERIAAGRRFALCQSSFSVSTSPEQLTAIFTPDSLSTVAGSAGVFALTVGPDATSTSVSASRSSVTVGGSVTYTAVVSPTHPGPNPPSGVVQFEDRGEAIRSCANQPVQSVSGVLAATCSVRYGKAGVHTIIGIYDGDSEFTGSFSNVVQVPVQVRGTIAASMQWSFKFARSYTAVLALELSGAPAGATVRITCRGGGCPFAERALAVSRRKSCPRHHGKCRRRRNRTVDLAPGLRKHRLRPGAHLVVAITRPGWIGKRYLFVMRAGKGPGVQIACLAPGAARPGVGC
jgi:Bacterial Ig-like domain (group 3)/Invasin, domain 3